TWSAGMVAGMSGVQIGPGATLLARIPRSASIPARAADMFAMPPLVTSYASNWGDGLSELTDVVPMIEPPGGMCGTAALTRKKYALRFVATVRFHSSSEISSTEEWVAWNAALLTRTSIRPN